MNDIKQAVLSVDESADVLLFGSRARGDFEEESDWDILILTNEEVNREYRLDLIGTIITLEIRYAIGISPVFKNKSEWSELEGTDFYSNVKEDGVIL